MGILTICILVLVVVLGLTGVLSRGVFSTLSRLLLLLVVVAFTALTLFLLYGTVAWSGRGGGVLFLFAIPAGVIAWIAFGMLSSSLTASRYYDMPPEQQQQFARETFDQTRSTFMKTIAENEQKLKQFWLRPDQRRRLQGEIAEAMAHLRSIEMMEQRYRNASGDPARDNAPEL